MFDKDLSLNSLYDFFPSEEVEWRIQSSGITQSGRPWARALAYIDARAIQWRLDSVVGFENWKVDYVHLPTGVMCGLSIKIKGEWVTKWDGSQETEIEAFKGGISKAFVRTASVWGIGRYLYRLPTTFVEFTTKEASKNLPKDTIVNPVKIDNQTFLWLEPKLPTWCLPKEKRI